MSQFSSNESTSLEKTIILQQESSQCPDEQIEKVYELEKCVSWIKQNNFNKICLQFPDHLLCDSAKVTQQLQEKSQRKIYVLADTAYETCCIDYVAAEHIQADAIIHFGPICFSQTSQKTPFLNIYEKQPLVIHKFIEIIRKQSQSDPVIVLDTPFIHLEQHFTDITSKILRIDAENLNVQGENVVFICDKHRKLLNFQLSHHPKSLFYYNEKEGLVDFQLDSKLIKRRYFLIEKIKDSNTIGIIIGTLGVKNYLEQIERLKKLVELNKKKYYLISVGKPTVAKLANFPEIDVYVIVTCAMNEIYETRDYFKPIVTPFDVEIALNPLSHQLSFSYNFNNYVYGEIPDEIEANHDVSLISGKIRGGNAEGSSLEVVAKENALIRSSGPGFLSERSWKGLEQNLETPPEVKLAEEGRRGLAQHYQNET